MLEKFELKKILNFFHMTDWHRYLLILKYNWFKDERIGGSQSKIVDFLPQHLLLR